MMGEKTKNTKKEILLYNFYCLTGNEEIDINGIIVDH